MYMQSLKMEIEIKELIPWLDPEAEMDPDPGM